VAGVPAKILKASITERGEKGEAFVFKLSNSGAKKMIHKL
jgi:hypothetical protein